MPTETFVPNAGNLLNEVLTADGGLSDLMLRFDQAGLGEHVRSWIGEGENRPVTARQIEQVIPPDRLDQLGETHGFPPGSVSGVLAHLLPHAIDSATEGGRVP